MLRMARGFIASLILTLLATVSFGQSEYRIEVGDRVVIEVLEDSALNRAVVVLPDGRISFPFAGTVRAAGRTVSQVEAAITAAISNQFQDRPTVFVAVQPFERFEVPEPLEEAETISVYFVGEVNQPGLREVEPGTSFLQAVSQSGGLTRFAATKRIQLRRTGSSGRETIVTINYRALSRGSALDSDVILVDGDVILVPERRLFE